MGGAGFESRGEVLPCEERVVSAKLRRRVRIREHNVPGHACDRRMIKTICAVDLSGGINAAPMWMRQYQDSAEMKLPTAQPFDEEHGIGERVIQGFRFCVRLPLETLLKSRRRLRFILVRQA